MWLNSMSIILFYYFGFVIENKNILYPRYTKYIVTFSVTMCECVCLYMYISFFSSKISQELLDSVF